MAELFVGGTVDPATHERTGDDIRIDADDLTTHAVIVGMTGSGKTGLGIVLIEEVLSSGRPALVIDPKGDLTNLCLTFPALQPADFRPWIDERQAATEGLSPDAFAAQQAEAWSKGLAGWGLASANIAALQSAADFTIYTPGSRSGVPVDIVGSLQVPADMSDAELVGDEIEGYVSGLLGLVGISADPLTSREHILLSNLIAHAWGEGHALDLPTLVGMVGNPPIRKLGVFELDQFFPADARMQLALKLNGLLASPSFAAWADGPALDIGSMLYTTDGKPRCAIVTTAHLSDEERQFVTALVLSKLVTWMRRQSGTSQLRAVLYMDEVAGYLPPTANPPTKKPIMTLMKQARAFGLGVVLATQNPVDVDYKALSNAGTWMIGRLQTERDKQRLTEGLSSASGGIDVTAVAATISGLAKREFVLRRAGRDSTEVFTTRWAMCYLRGPMTRDQIARGDGGSHGDHSHERDRDSGDIVGAERARPRPRRDDRDATGRRRRRRAMDRCRRPVVGGGRGRRDRHEIGAGRRRTRAAQIRRHEGGARPRRGVRVRADRAHRSSRSVAGDGRRLRRPRSPHRAPDRSRVPNRRRTTRQQGLLRRHRARAARPARAQPHDRAPGEHRSEAVWAAGRVTDRLRRARCDGVADERAATEIAKLRDKYEAKATRIRDEIAAAEDRVDVLQAEAHGKRNDELLSTAGSILGDLLGGRSRSRALRSLGSAAGRRGRTAAAGERVDAAESKAGRLHDELANLEAELTTEIAGDRCQMAGHRGTDIDDLGRARANRRAGHRRRAGLDASRLTPG